MLTTLEIKSSVCLPKIMSGGRHRQSPQNDLGNTPMFRKLSSLSSKAIMKKYSTLLYIIIALVALWFFFKMIKLVFWVGIIAVAGYGVYWLMKKK